MANVPESIHEIDSSIAKLQHVLSMSPRSNPRRHKCVLSLALMRERRHILSDQREDLDKAIVYFTESILLLPFSYLRHGPIFLGVLFFLSRALVSRSTVSNHPEDAIYAAKYLFHLRDHPHECPASPRCQVTRLLLDALGLQVKLGAGNKMQSIRELAVLSRELLTSEMSVDDNTHLIIFISKVVCSTIRTGIPGQPLDETY